MPARKPKLVPFSPSFKYSLHQELQLLSVPEGGISDVVVVEALWSSSRGEQYGVKLAEGGKHEDTFWEVWKEFESSEVQDTLRRRLYTANTDPCYCLGTREEIAEFKQKLDQWHADHATELLETELKVLTNLESQANADYLKAAFRKKEAAQKVTRAFRRLSRLKEKE